MLLKSGRYLSTTARISICFPNGLKGSMRYKRIRKGDTGKADFTVKGRKRGMQSIILKPCDETKSLRLRSEYTVVWLKSSKYSR